MFPEVLSATWDIGRDRNLRSRENIRSLTYAWSRYVVHPLSNDCSGPRYGLDGTSSPPIQEFLTYSGCAGRA